MQKDLTLKLGIERKYTPALIWYFHLKDEKKYHLPIQTSTSSSVHKYSETALKKLQKELEEHSYDIGWLDMVKSKYNDTHHKKTM